ncbi:MAG: leucyl aminopeptidase [Ignavibacteria bacterium]|nr:leucyl aminopeptidase [Ignavibacteria bacterium]
MVTLTAQRSTLRTTRADLIAQFIFEDNDVFKKQIAELKASLKDISAVFKAATFRGKEQETLLLYPKGILAKRLLLVGLGKSEKLNLEKLRRASATCAKTAQASKAKSVGLVEPDAAVLAKARVDLGENQWESVGKALGEGAALGVYKFDKYLTSTENKNTLKQVIIASNDVKRSKQVSKGLKQAQVVCEATYFARDLENAPANEIYPASLARRVIASARRNKFRVRVFDKKKIKQLGMGGLLAVSQGSVNPPRFIIMEHNAGKMRMPTVVLVGKGVTFDSGGISIKPAGGMGEMKMDMSGAAAVIGTMQAAAQLKLPVHLVGLVPGTENLLGGAAMKPGDVLTHYNGKTSEVDNTDAEGRIILADALSYATRYKPELVIDLATLTGACVVALGHYATGMMGNDQDVMDQLKVSGERTYERVWQLPMYEEYEKLIKSSIADVKNVGGRWAGAITAAMFLKKFIGDYKWIHLDIAGTAILDESLDYIPKGGSGVGVRLLIDFLKHWKKG